MERVKHFLPMIAATLVTVYALRKTGYIQLTGY